MKNVKTFLYPSLFIVMLILTAASPSWADTTGSSAEAVDFTAYSLEELMRTEVFSVTKKAQKLSQTAAAVFVISKEDIRRSGFTTLPDMLRMVPGVQVARTDPGDFAVSARGFLGEFANKLLVLIDGRSIYSPLFSGVFWDFRDMLLEDIERIEVIRGPGATMWGSNAVNGVINIITKHARDTMGGMVTATVGNTDEWYEAVRYGGKLGEALHYRLYAKHIQFGAVENRRMEEPEYIRTGFRIDWEPSSKHSFVFTGDYYNGREKSWTSRPLINHEPGRALVKGHGYPSGLHLLGRWTYTPGPTSEMKLQIYYDRTRHRANRYTNAEQYKDSSDLEKDESALDTFDVDLQHRFVPFARHEIIWGLGFRMHKDHKRERNVFYVLDPRSRYVHIYSGFIQDEITLLKDRLKLILGSKFEYNSYTDFEVQPTLRILWTPDARQTVWAAVSRAVRLPSHFEHDGRVRLGVLPRIATGSFRKGLIEWQGTDSFDSETMMAYELGYRIQATSTFSWDMTAFYNYYKELRTVEPTSPMRSSTYILYPLKSDNKMKGRTYGLEIAATWQVRAWWRLQASFTWLQMNLNPKTDSRANNASADENLSPSTQWTLRSLIEISPRVELDTGLYFTDDIPGFGIKRYLNLCIRLGWRPVKNLELSLIGQNLLDNKHNEFSDEVFRRAESEVRRTIYGRICWNF